MPKGNYKMGPLLTSKVNLLLVNTCKHNETGNSKCAFCQRESTLEPSIGGKIAMTKIRLYRSKTRLHSSRMSSDLGHKSGSLRRFTIAHQPRTSVFTLVRMSASWDPVGNQRRALPPGSEELH